MTTVAVLSHMVDSNTRRKLILTSGVTLGALSGCLGLFDDENGDGNGSDSTEQTQDEQAETETATQTEENTEEEPDTPTESDDCPDGTSFLGKFDFEDCEFVQTEFGDEECDIEIKNVVNKEDEECEPIGFEWTTDGCEVHQIRLFGGQDTETFDFDSETSGVIDSDLVNPGGQQAAISNVTFCGRFDDEDDENGENDENDEEDEKDDEKDKPDIKDGVSIEPVDYDKRKGKAKFKVYNKTDHKVELTWKEYDGEQEGTLKIKKDSYKTFWADVHGESLKIVLYFDGKQIDYAEIDTKYFHIENNVRIKAIDYDKHRHKAKFRIYNDTKNDVDVMWKEYNGDQKSHTRVGRNGNRTFWVDMKGDSMKLVLYYDDKEIDYAEIDTGDYKKKPDVENEVEIHPDCYDKSDKKATFKIKNATSHHIEVTWKEYGGKHEETVKVRMNDNRHIHVPMKDNGDEMKVVLYFDGKEIDYAELSKDHYCDEYAA